MEKNISNIKIRSRKNNSFADSIVFSSELECIIDEIHKKFNVLKKIDIKRIIDSQFRMLKQTMNNAGDITEDSNLKDFKSIRLFKIGSFRPSEKKFMYIQKYLKSK